MLQFGQKSVERKDFYKTKRISDVSTLDHDKTMVSKSIPCNNGKDKHLQRCSATTFLNTPKVQPRQWGLTWKIV